VTGLTRYFEIMSLTPTVTFYVSLADTISGRVIGGVVVGSLIAYNPVQISKQFSN